MTGAFEQTQPAEPAAPGDSPPRLEPEQWIERYGDLLYRYAWARLRDRSAAEDLVQETLLEAFKSRATFAGACSEKSWLFAILKHNLIDFLRRKTPQTEPMNSGENVTADWPWPFQESGLHKGSWQSGSEPIDWGSPETELSKREFWNVFHRCASKLPKETARVVLLRELEGLSTDEICAAAQITPGNFWVILHRARLALQQCLQTNWFK